MKAFSQNSAIPSAAPARRQSGAPSPQRIGATSSAIDVSGMARTVRTTEPRRTSNREQLPTSTTAAALLVACKRHPGGLERVARLISMSADVLQKKLSATCTTHHVTMLDAERIQDATGDPAAAVEFARRAGLACLPMPSVEGGELHRTMADVGQEFADLVRAFADATRDNQISPNECARLERELTELFIAGNHLLAQMRAKAEERTPVIEVGVA